MANSWLDQLIDRGTEAQQHLPAEPIPAAAREVQCVWVQTRAPRNGDCGAAEAGHYFVENGTVIMCSEEAKPTGQSERLTTGGDAKAVAGRLRKRAWLKEQGTSERFNRPLAYARSGNA